MEKTENVKRLEAYSEAAIKLYAKARPSYAPPHPSMFAAAKQLGLTVAVDGELEEARTDWCDDLIDEGVDDNIRVDVYEDSKRLGYIVFRWEDLREVKVRVVQAGEAPRRAIKKRPVVSTLRVRS